MANSITHARLPYPIRHARYTLLVPYLDADGDPTDPTTPDTEVSQDGGAFADAAEEMTTISGSNGMGFVTLSGAEMNNSAVGVACKAASGPKNTLAALYPRDLPILAAGTASAGASGSITLASSITYDITGCFIRTTGGTGGGGTGGANNQARRITAYNTSTQVATVLPAWETTPDVTTTYDVLCPEGVTPGMLKALNPTSPGRTFDVAITGEGGLDFNNVLSTSLITLNSLAVTGALTLSGAVSLGSTLTVTGAITATSAGNNLTLGTFTVTTNAVAWNAAWDTEVQSEVDDALIAHRLDELINADSDIDGAAPPTVGSVFHELMSKTAGSFTFDQTTDSNEAIRDRGDAAWIAATGFALASVCTEARLSELDAANLPADIDQIKADLPTRITKNTALSAFPFFMVDETDLKTPEAGLTVTATRSLDGAAFAACANAVSEISNGWYKIDLAAADLNGNTVALKFTATGASQRSLTLITQPT